MLTRSRGDQSDLRRVTREAGAAAQLNDPQIAAVYDVLEVEGRPCIVMEYVPGETLAQHARGRTLAPAEVVRLGMRIASALEHAHGAGIIHCDLKPANIKVMGDGAVKILDFGLARRSVRRDDAMLGADTAPSTTLAGVAGTPGYMSPEQLLGRALDARTDLYSLGVILYELVAGARPFRGTDIVSLALTVMTQPTPPLPETVPPPLGQVIERCLEKEPEARYPSAAAVREALASIPMAALVDGAQRSRRAIVAALVAAAVVLAMLGVAGALRWTRGRARPPAAPGVVVILPFTGVDGTTEAPTATGLADILAADLADVPGVVLVPRAASLNFSADPRSFPAVARELGADHAITGAIIARDGGLKVTISFVDLQSGGTEWSRRFEGRADDILSLERQIADESVAQFRRAGSAAAAQARAAHAVRPTVDRQAFEDYSQGRVFLDRSDDAGNIDRAMTLFESAVARDKHFALAHAAIGEACARRYALTRDARWADRARDATLEALRLDPGQPMVRYALATIYRGSGKVDEAIEELRKAIQLQPSNDEFHRLLGRIYGDRNRTDDAIAELMLAKALRPGFWDNYRALGLVYYKVGRYDEAIAALTRATELQPDSNSGFQMLGTVYHAAGDLDHAFASYTRANAIKPSPTAWANIGMIRHHQGRFADAVDAYKQSIALRPKEPITFRNLGDAYARLPDAAAARAAYQRAIDLSKDALSINPRAAATMALQAVCEAKLGRFDQATRLAEQAVALLPASGEVLYQQAVVEALAGHEVPAVKALTAALEHGHSRQIAREDDELSALRRRPDVAALLAGSAGEPH